MSIKISELPAASSVNSADIVPIVQDGTTKQAQAEMLKPQIETVINSSSTNDKPVGAKAVYDYSAPIKHDSETQEYGVATTTKYGHTKIIDSLDSSSYQVGESLSAYQGAVLKQSIDNINDDIESITDELATKQTTSNMTNTLDENSTNTQYPNAKVTFEKYNELLNQIPTATATGNPINVQDSSNLPIKDFTLLGNATQADTPTPDTPQDIHVVTGDNTVKVLGKNLFNANDIIGQYSSGIIFTGTPDNFVVSKADTANSRDITYILPKNTYTIKFTINSTNMDGQVRVIYDDDTYLQLYAAYGTAVSNVDVSKITDSTKNIKAIRFVVYNRTYEIKNLIIELGNNDYEPYTETTQLLSLGSIELAKIGTYTDRIFKDSGKWYVEKNIATKTLNGTENWQSASSVASGTTRFYYEYNNDLKALWDICLISDHFVATTWGTIYQTDTTSKNLIATNDSTTNRRFVIRIDNNYASTVEDFKTWLGNNNTLVYYILKTPTTTEITDTTLIAQLENVLKMHTNKNVTNISIVPTGTNAEPTAEVEYRVDLGTVIGNINNAIISLGGNV